MQILLIDNNDSFSYNLLHLIKSTCLKEDNVEICLKNNISISKAKDFDRIILSPGPGMPSESGILSEIVRTYEKKIPILGVCLGHQAIAESYGALLFNLSNPVHGMQTEIRIIDHTDLFRGVNSTIMAGRYHSWGVSKKNLPDCLKITASDIQGNIMALSHKQYAIYGVQFHPESFMTECGQTIIRNFIQRGIR